MLVFRFLTVTILAFLLLSPMIRISEKVVEKPIVIFGIDNSESVLKTKDSAFYRKTWPSLVEKTVKELASKAEVKIYSFDEQVKDGFNGSYNGKKTDISGFFREINTRFVNRNIAAIVLASDGIYNQGSDPWYAARNFQVPVYTVGLGDTAIRKDAIIKKVISNKVAYKNDRFPVEILVELNKCNPLKTKLILSKGDIELDSREIQIPSAQSSQHITFWLDANQLGINKYHVNLVPLSGETNFDNNHADFLIEVRDTRQKAALVYNSPHPDIMSIYSALSNSSHFELTLVSDPSKITSWDAYDLVILHEIPSINTIRDLTPLMKSKASLLFILGTLSDINAFNNLKAGLVINSGKNSFYDSEPLLNSNFSLFTINSQDQLLINEFPPLQSPFGNYLFSPVSETMVFQQIANVTTKTPLILFTKTNDKKVGIIAGENIWRWRMTTYIKQSSFEIFDNLVDKIAIYLSAREDKSFLRITVKNRFSENEPVELEAEVFNKSYERITTAEVNLTITDQEKKRYPFLFSKGNGFYYLKAGIFPVGEYKWEAVTQVGNETYRKAGEFFVNEVNTESISLIADHQLLNRISLSHDARMVKPDSLSQLSKLVLAREEIKSLSSKLVKLSDLISTPWIFILLMLLLSAEWIMRKREGR